MTNPHPPGEPDARLNELAVLSLASAFLVSLMAVITGHIALAQIRRTGEKGRELALAGVIIGYIGLAASTLFSLMIVVAVLVGVATGSFDGFRAVPDARGPRTSAVPTPSPEPFAPSPSSPSSPGSPDTSGDITFDDGNDLRPGTVPHISDGLLGDKDWKLTTPRADGTWVYSSKDGLCTTTYHEGELDSGLDVTAGDDLATTDSYLAAITSSPAADIADYADDDYLALGQPETSDSSAGLIVETRRLAGNANGSDDAGNGRPQVTVARAFAALDQGVSITISCTTKAQAVDAYDHVLSRTALLVN